MDTNGVFIRSCEDYLNYPKNLIQHDALSHTIKAYHERLEFHSKSLFNEKPKQAAVDFLDLNNGDTTFSKCCVSDLREMKLLLREALSLGQSDPRCRYIFLHAPHSRATLRVSHPMLAFLFSYHQVMPSFLDFIFPFGKQVYARDAHFSGLREESRFDKRRDNAGNPNLGRSGSDLRICYNLRSVERSTEQPGLQWSIRQTAIYHEFDVKTGRALWIFIKGNKLIKERITEASALSSLTKLKSISEMFSATLAPHLLLCDWAGENWRWYINDLEEQLQKLTRDVLAAQVDRPPSPTPSPLVAESSMGSPSRSSTFPMLSRSTTGRFSGKSQTVMKQNVVRTDSGFILPATPSQTPTLVNNSCLPNLDNQSQNFHSGSIAKAVSFSRIISELKSGTSRLWKVRHEEVSQSTPIIEMQNKSSSEDGQFFCKKGTPPPCGEYGEGKQEILTFKDLQRIQYIEEKAQEALLVLKSNGEVLEELKQYYTYATSHDEFPSELSNDCEAELARFERCVLSVEKDLRMLQSRTLTLIHLLGNRKSLLNGILQYRSNKASESSAKKAEVSASQMAALTLDMHEIAQKTKRETVSMRVITSVTLFFLPATFLATFMSTDILKFDGEKKNFQLNGLKLYLAVALPLTALTFLAWYVIYRLAGKGQISSRIPSGSANKANVV
ncbi:hypothetical protein GQ44DRAFT_831069 [Phaeosphaeriaceae sp. PMI808]|nr:hypothetical protein GQ44DRAFT_831069 [Phaeosphaeriaceae sp. PMI808]